MTEYLRVLIRDNSEKGLREIVRELEVQYKEIIIEYEFLKRG